MDVTAIAGLSIGMRVEQTGQAVSISMLKQEAAQQQSMATILEQNSRQVLRSAAGSDTGFSIYA